MLDPAGPITEPLGPLLTPHVFPMPRRRFVASCLYYCESEQHDSSESGTFSPARVHEGPASLDTSPVITAQPSSQESKNKMYRTGGLAANTSFQCTGETWLLMIDGRGVVISWRAAICCPVRQTHELEEELLKRGATAMLDAYQRYGHYEAQLDPLGLRAPR